METLNYFTKNKQMIKLKDEFTFNYKNKSIQVRKIGEVHCAIFEQTNPPTAKPLNIEIYEDQKHKGKISTREGVFLSFLPTGAIEGEKPKRMSNKDLIQMHELPLFCEICLSSDKINLEVHHIKEHAVTHDDSKDNLRVYCSSCHVVVHAIRTVQRRAVLKYTTMDRKEYDKKINL